MISSDEDESQPETTSQQPVKEEPKKKNQIFDSDDDDNETNNDDKSDNDDNTDTVGTATASNNVDDDDMLGEMSDSDSDVEDKTAFKVDKKYKKKDLTSSVLDDDDDDDDTRANTGAHGGIFDDSDDEPVEHSDGKRAMSMTEYDLGDGLALVKMPNFLSIDYRPFNPETYVDATEDDDGVYRDELGRKRVKLKVENMIRWRYAADEEGKPILLDNGEYKRESNANVVQWSDGSESLVIGDQLVQYKRDDNKEKHSGIYIIEKVEGEDEETAGDAMNAVATLDEKVHLQLYNTKSKMHEEVTRNVAISAGKKQKIKEITMDENPDTTIQRRRKEFTDVNRKEMNDKARMSAKQQRARNKSSRTGGGMSTRFLDNDDDFSDSDADEDHYDTSDRTKRDNKRFVDSDDDDEEAAVGDEDEAEQEATPKKKRARVLNDSDDSD